LSVSNPCSSPATRFSTSHWPLKASSGTLRGTYQMVTSDGEQFDVEIAGRPQRAVRSTSG
jgi:uncharacterized protein affecting Mg2+/Co2+ transport